MSEPRRPLVIAHRGASGYLTEHTFAAKKLAHDQLADFLEQDVVATRDEELIVCHDLYLERVTNVAEVFPQRHRDDGHFYVADFDWAEVQRLERRSIPPRFADADRAALVAMAGDSDGSRLHTLSEELEFIARLNAASSHSAGVYTEVKHPGWYREHGFDLTRAVVRALEGAGYREADGSAYIQCFDADELRRIRETLGSPLPLVQLVGRTLARRTLTPAGLAKVAEYAAAIAPKFALLFRRAETDRPVLSALTDRARDAGLAIHPYTFNNQTLPIYANDLAGFLRTVYGLVNPDAVFCDFPDVAVAARESQAVADGHVDVP
jgi:glycerophosphoryl diester phosphodiesterase